MRGVSASGAHHSKPRRQRRSTAGSGGTPAFVAASNVTVQRRGSVGSNGSDLRMRRRSSAGAAGGARFVRRGHSTEELPRPHTHQLHHGLQSSSMLSTIGDSYSSEDLDDAFHKIATHHNQNN